MLNALVFLCTEPHELRSASGVRNPVRTSSSRLMPSTPTRYWMPNAGIQAWRSTNWKSPEAGLKRLHSSSVSANTSSEMVSAILRTIGALSSSSPRTKSSRMAPATGSATSEVRIGKGIRASTPQVVPEDEHHSQQQRRRIGAHRPALRPPEQLGARADGLGDAVHGAVDDANIDDLPQPLLRRNPDRLHDGG